MMHASKQASGRTPEQSSKAKYRIPSIHSIIHPSQQNHSSTPISTPATYPFKKAPATAKHETLLHLSPTQRKRINKAHSPTYVPNLAQVLPHSRPQPCRTVASPASKAGPNPAPPIGLIARFRGGPRPLAFCVRREGPVVG